KLTEDTRGFIERLAVDGASAHPNQLFLLGNALRSKQIQEFSEHFTLYAAAKGIEFAQEHPGVRLLSNLLGSLPLDDSVTQYNGMQHIVFLDMLRGLFPRIALSKKTTSILYKSTGTIIKIGSYTGDNCAPTANAIMKYFREYKKQARESLFGCLQLKSFNTISSMFPVLLADKSTRHTDEIRALIMDVEEKDRERALDAKVVFDLFVFFASLQDDSTPHELVLALGSRVVPRSIQAYNRNKYVFSIKSQAAAVILEALNTYQSALLEMPSGEEVFKGMQGILQYSIDQKR
ncbi:uncharacterized protein NEMAJ01_2002, partial [Nematocida major]